MDDAEMAAFIKGARDTLGIHLEPHEVGPEIPQAPPPNPWHFDHKPTDPRQPRGSSDFKEDQWPSAK